MNEKTKRGGQPASRKGKRDEDNGKRSDLPVDYDKEESARIKKAAEKIQGDSDVLLVIGIGGSCLGARAAIEFLSHSFSNNLPKDKRSIEESGERGRL